MRRYRLTDTCNSIQKVLSCITDIDECSLIVPNGFCDHLCINTYGSYHCDCREGYRLFRTFFCQGNNHSYHYSGIIFFSVDIDECEEGIDDCNKTGSTPAKCINEEGGYTCSCDSHRGYELSLNNQTCEGIDNNYSGYFVEIGGAVIMHIYITDIDECQLNSHLCTNTCINTAGSYVCSCPVGFKLDQVDGRFCHGLCSNLKGYRDDVCMLLVSSNRHQRM